MLTFLGANRHFCDGLTRRDFLHVGGLGLAGLTLADLLRLRADGAATAPSRSRAVIMVYLAGGPSHIDMYDLKPDAPAEFRGPFRPIRTNVTGLQLCELMPRQAQNADKFALIRNMKFHCDRHQPWELLTGNEEKFPDRVPGFVPRFPDFGTKVSYLRKKRGVPSHVLPYVALSGARKFHNNLGETDSMSSYPGYLGPAYDAFHNKPISFREKKTPDGLIANNDPIGLKNLSLRDGMSKERLQERAALARSFDGVRRQLDDPHGSLAALDAFQAQALEMLVSGKVREAFDVGREPDRVRARYGEWGVDYLLARRLVEAGVPIVTLNPGHSARAGASWDHHKDVKTSLSAMLPEFDQGLSALITDLHERGLDRDVVVVVWGEMGRTPRLNKNRGGRDHWSSAGFALLAGGGFRMGQVIGATDARATEPRGHPYYPKDILATLYRFLGYRPDQTTIPDLQGRPVYLVEGAKPIPELA
jgi:hypothetical protein